MPSSFLGNIVVMAVPVAQTLRFPQGLTQGRDSFTHRCQASSTRMPGPIWRVLAYLWRIFPRTVKPDRGGDSRGLWSPSLSTNPAHGLDAVEPCYGGIRLITAGLGCNCRESVGECRVLTWRSEASKRLSDGVSANAFEQPLGPATLSRTSFSFYTPADTGHDILLRG